MIREITVKMYFDVDDEYDLTPSKRVEAIVKEELKEIYCDDEGYRYIKVRCEDYNDERSVEIMKNYIEELELNDILSDDNSFDICVDYCEAIDCTNCNYRNKNE